MIIVLFNNIYFAKILNPSRLNFAREKKKPCCVRHIFNLIGKTFIFCHKSQIFNPDIAINKKTHELDSARKLERMQDAIRKLHNLIQFILILSSIEAMFTNLVDFFFEKLDEFNNDICHLTIIDDNRTCWNLTYFSIQCAFCLQRHFHT